MDITDDFVDQYSNMVNARVHARLKREPDLYDADLEPVITSAVWERVLRTDNYDEDKGAVSTWLFYIIESVISNEIKKYKRSEDALDNYAQPLETAHNVIGAEDAGTAGDELTRLLDHAMRQNLVHARDVRILKDKHLGGYTAEELAKRYDLEVSTIYSILRDTMQALRECAAG